MMYHSKVPFEAFNVVQTCNVFYLLYVYYCTFNLLFWKEKICLD